MCLIFCNKFRYLIPIYNEYSLAHGTPASYMVSENASFTGATWNTYTPNFNYVLSAGNGGKIVYFRTRNISGISPSYSSAITLNETALRVALANFDANKNAQLELQNNNTVSIYPKPADQKINLSFNKTFESAITVKLFDLNGKEVQRATIAPQKEPINYALDFDMKITPGMYIISISSGTYRHSEKIIVK